MRGDVIIRYIELPIRVNAVTVPDEDGNYNVYINDRLSREAQQEAYEHELYHIEHGHHYNYIPVADCEKEKKSRLGTSGNKKHPVKSRGEWNEIFIVNGIPIGHC